MGGATRGIGCRSLGLALATVVVALAALLVPAVASARLIYVAPDDQSGGFLCTDTQPCALAVGINGVLDDGDEVLLAPGTYDTDDELEVMAADSGTTIRPRDPGTRPVINSTASIALQLSGQGATVRGIEIRHDNPGTPGLFALASGTRIVNVISISNGDTPCQVASTRLTDTICHATAAGARALRISLAGGAGTSIVRNATLVADGAFGVGIYATASGTASATLDVASTIVQGPGNDVVAIESDDGTATVVLASSNFDTRSVSGGATATLPGTGSNQTAAPIFTGPTYEQAAGSPTVDAGLVDAETGATDVYGDARPQGAANDIGADELAVPAPPADTTPPETTITKGPKRKSKKRKATFAFVSSESGSTFECSLDRGAFEACDSTLKLTKLKRRKHVLAVRAIDAAGNADATPASAKWKVKKKRKR